jgi:cell division initiation protein
MEVSAKTLREVEFREKMRGYHPEDVDHFLEQVAAGIEVLHDRLRQAVERAQRAEAAAAEAGGTDETLRKTLILAQRTADMAVQEAREQASRILAGAEQQAQAVLSEAEDRGRRVLDEALAESKAELTRLEANRSQAQHDVDTLERWIDEHKHHLQAALSEALAAVERAGVQWPAPSTRAIDVPGGAQAKRPTSPPPPAPATESPQHHPGPETAAWSPSDEERAEVAGARPDFSPPVQASAPDPSPQPPAEMSAGHDDEQALNDFFDDQDDDDRRLGRLRRRR